MSDETPKTQETKRCPVCDEEIGRNARKCVHCEAQFGWRRYIGVSNTTLALLTALFSVAGLVYPGLHRSLVDVDDSVISLRFDSDGISTSPSEKGLPQIGFNFLASNTGLRAGAIHFGALYVDKAGDRRDEDAGFILYLSTPEGKPFLVEPGKITLITLQPRGISSVPALEAFLQTDFATSAFPGNCRFSVNVTNYRGAVQIKQIASSLSPTQFCYPALFTTIKFLQGHPGAISDR